MTNVVTESALSEQDIFRIVAKKRLLDLGWSITQLANKVKASRTAVSMAINHGHNSGVLADIREVLDL